MAQILRISFKTFVMLYNSYIFFCIYQMKASLVAQIVKNLPAMQETWVWSLGWEDPWRRSWQPNSSILAWRTPWTEKPGGYSPCSHKELDMIELLSTWKTIYWYLDVAFSPIRNDTAALDCILNSYCNLHVPSCNQVLCLKNSFVVVQLLSHVQFCETPWIAAHQVFPSITISQFAQTHVYWVSDTIQPSHHLSPFLLPSIFPIIRIFSNELTLLIKCPLK